MPSAHIHSDSADPSSAPANRAQSSAHASVMPHALLAVRSGRQRRSGYPNAPVLTGPRWHVAGNRALSPAPGVSGCIYR